MALLRSRRTRAADELETAGDLAGAIEELSRVNRSHRDPAHERRLIELRHRAGELLVAAPGASAEYVAPASGSLPAGDGLAEIDAAELTAPVLREAVLTKGSLLVRGLVPRDDALRLAAGIDRRLRCARAGRRRRRRPLRGVHDPRAPRLRSSGASRPETRRDVDRRLAEARLRGPRAASSAPGCSTVLTDYLGETPALSAQKCTLRKVATDTRADWHQDGRFLGDGPDDERLALALATAATSPPGSTSSRSRFDDDRRRPAPRARTSIGRSAARWSR